MYYENIIPKSNSRIQYQNNIKTPPKSDLKITFKDPTKCLEFLSERGKTGMRNLRETTGRFNGWIKITRGSAGRKTPGIPFPWENSSSFTDVSPFVPLSLLSWFPIGKGPRESRGFRSIEPGSSMDPQLWWLVLLPVLAFQPGSHLAAGEDNSLWDLFP